MKRTTPAQSSYGTPVVTLGFTRDELDAMEAQAFPAPIETWIHGLITATLEHRVFYDHPLPDEPEGDAYYHGAMS